jgi:small-conductance mechanosensitive channel
MESDRIDGWLVATGVAAGAWAFGWLVRVTVLPLFARLASRSRTQVDDALLRALRPHVPVWFLLLGVVVGARYAPLEAVVRGRIDRGAEALLILSLSLATTRFLTLLLDRSAARWSGTPGGTSLVQNVVRVGVLGLGVLVILSNLGVSVTPMLTALGLGSLAIALGLQPTLTNLFAGFHITMGRQVRVGDYVELDNGMQGFVEDVGWRATQIRELANNRVVVPNAKLAEIVLRNYSLPGLEMGVVVPVGVAYGADLGRVEQVTLEVARGVQRETEGAVPEFEPFVRFAGFGDSAIQMNVILRARTVTDRFLVISEFVRRLHIRYHTEGIEIPFPQRVVRTIVEPGGAAPAEAAEADG